MRVALPALILLILAGNAAAAALEDLPAVKQLPDPFTFKDGSPVKSPGDWDRRRAEIKQLFAEYEYGPLPSKPEKIEVITGEITKSESGVDTLPLEVKLSHEGRDATLNIKVSLPPGTEKVPVVIQPGFGRLRPRRLGQNFQIPDFAKQFVDRGYAYAEFVAPEVAVDNRETAPAGAVYDLFGKDIDTGGLIAWAWGFHRTIDALEKVDRIDTEKIVVTGHSRYGKAALIAGAFDERIAVTAPSHSGCAGTAPFRFIYGNSEQLHNIAGAFPYWFRPGFGDFAEKVEYLPVDQHMLRALVAPRAQISTEGTEDRWCNPEGSQLTYLAAKEVYKFLGAEDKITIRTRATGHIPNNDDVMDFADHVFYGKPLSDEFGKLSYPVEENAYSWAAPVE